MAALEREVKWACRVAIVLTGPILLFVLFFGSPHHRNDDLLHQAAVLLDLPFFLVAEWLTRVAGLSKLLFNIVFFLIQVLWVFLIVLVLRLFYVFIAGRQRSTSPPTDT